MKTQIKKPILCCLLSCLFAACSQTPLPPKPIRHDSGPRHPIDCTKIPDAVPKKEPKSRYGNLTTYKVDGKEYHVLHSARGYHKRGVASWYGEKFDGRLTSNRERYNMLAMTAASKELPLPTYVRVKNLENGRSVVVRVNDRGPFVGHRILDLSYAAARKLGYAEKGITRVDVQSLSLYTPPKKAAPRIYLQLGVFSNYQYAQALKARFVPHVKYKKVEVYPIKHTTPQPAGVTKPLYSVRIGPLTDLNASDLLFRTLQPYGLKDAIAVLQ